MASQVQDDGALRHAQEFTSANTHHSDNGTTLSTTPTSTDIKAGSTSLPRTPRILPTSAPFLDDTDEIDLDPQSHFLSPMASYEYWSDDDEDDDDVPDWDAGIIDFGLFYEDHKNADVPLPSKWNGLLADQAQLYERNAKQSNTAVEPAFLSRTGSGDSLPSLTPDVSPRVRDDMEYDSDSDGLVMPTRQHVPHFNLIITPPEEDIEAALAEAATGDETDEEDYLPLPFFVKRSQAQRKGAAQFVAPVAEAAQPKLTRPGLRSDRTLSGKRHSWVKPSRGLWSIREGVREEAAEAEDVVARPERAVLRRGRTF